MHGAVVASVRVSPTSVVVCLGLATYVRRYARRRCPGVKPELTNLRLVPRGTSIRPVLRVTTRTSAKSASCIAAQWLVRRKSILVRN